MNATATPYRCQGYISCGSVEDGQQVHAARCQSWNVAHGFQPVRPGTFTPDPPEAPVHLSNEEAMAWQSGWEAGWRAFTLEPEPESKPARWNDGGEDLASSLD